MASVLPRSAALLVFRVTKSGGNSANLRVLRLPVPQKDDMMTELHCDNMKDQAITHVMKHRDIFAEFNQFNPIILN